MTTTTRGALIFAYNNESIDYEKIARFNQKQIEQHLGIPTTIVTGTPTTANLRTFRYSNNETEKVSWHNTDRMTAYDLSPYDETILLDADYLVFSDNLSFVWDIPNEFLCADRVYDVTGSHSFDSDRMMSKTSFPMRWATCVYFKKTEFAKSVFGMMREIRENYLYYSHLFNFRASPYRNDFALSIALQILSGYNDKSNHFHFPLASVTTTADITSIDGDRVVIDYEYADKIYSTRTEGLDLHVMNKKSLMGHLGGKR